MARVPDAREFYLDSLSRVDIDHYAKGRVVLLGDAAYGNTLGGFGTGLAVVGAYVLAGELAAADGDHRVAFRRYEELFRAYATISRRATPARSSRRAAGPGWRCATRRSGRASC